MMTSRSTPGISTALVLCTLKSRPKSKAIKKSCFHESFLSALSHHFRTESIIKAVNNPVRIYGSNIMENSQRVALARIIPEPIAIIRSSGNETTSFSFSERLVSILLKAI